MFGALVFLAGCANSDFGELNQTLVTDGIHDWLGRDSLKSHPVPASTFEYTDDERALRDNAYPLIEPPYDRQKWNQVAGEYGVKRATVTDRHVLYERLFEECHRSSAALYARLIDDIRNDTTRLSQFFETAGRVIDIDMKREKSLAYVSEIGKADRANAARRVRENAHVVELVRWSLEDRVLAYQYVLERLVISTPMAEADGGRAAARRSSSARSRGFRAAADLAARAEPRVVQLVSAVASHPPPSPGNRTGRWPARSYDLSR